MLRYTKTGDGFVGVWKLSFSKHMFSATGVYISFSVVDLQYLFNRVSHMNTLKCSKFLEFAFTSEIENRE